LNEVQDSEASGRLYDLSTEPEGQINAIDVPEQCFKYTGQSLDGKKNREEVHFQYDAVMKRSHSVSNFVLELFNLLI
jgi:hypothetical protein